MSRALLTITDRTREKAVKWCRVAPIGTTVEFRQDTRSGDQNKRLWAMLTDVAEQVMWHGMKLSTDDWKLIFLDALNREVRIVPNIDDNGFVNLGRSSSKLTKSEFSDLMELMSAFGARHGVVWSEPVREAA